MNTDAAAAGAASAAASAAACAAATVAATLKMVVKTKAAAQAAAEAAAEGAPASAASVLIEPLRGENARPLCYGGHAWEQHRDGCSVAFGRAVAA